MMRQKPVRMNRFRVNRIIKKKNRFELKRLIKKYGSAYRTAKVLGISPQALYEHMDRLGMPRAGYPLLPGEPHQKCAKIAWLRGLVGKKSVKSIARDFHRSESAVRARMSCYGITLKLPLTTRVRILAELLEKHKTGFAVAKILKVSPQAVYERMERHGLK